MLTAALLAWSFTDAMSSSIPAEPRSQLLDLARRSLMQSPPCGTWSVEATLVPAALGGTHGAVPGPVRQRWTIVSDERGMLFIQPEDRIAAVNSAEGSFRMNLAEHTVHVLRPGYDPLGVGVTEMLLGCEGVDASTIHPGLVDELDNATVVSLDRTAEHVRVRYVLHADAVAGSQVPPWEWTVSLSTDVPRVIERSMTVFDAKDGPPSVRSRTAWSVDEWSDSAGRMVPRRLKQRSESGGLVAVTTFEIAPTDSPGEADASLLDSVYRHGWEVVDERIGLRLRVGDRRFSFGGCEYDAAQPLHAHPRADLEEVVRHAAPASK